MIDMKFMKKLSLYLSIFTLAISVSSVAYAGFTRQYTPQVKGFGIGVATQENMLISADGRTGTFKDLITYDELFDATDTTLQPLYATVEKTENMYENLILRDGSNSVVYTSRNPDDDNNVTSPYLEFNLFFTSSSTMNLFLGNDLVRNIITIDNTTGNANFEDYKKQAILANMRIAFLTYETTHPEDYSGVRVEYSPAPVKASVYSTAPTTDTYSDYGFSVTGYNAISGQGKVIATPRVEVDATTGERTTYVTKMKVVVWLEKAGLDDSLLPLITDLKLNIAFQAAKV